MEVRAGIVAALAFSLNAACAFNTEGLSRSAFDDPEDTAPLGSDVVIDRDTGSDTFTADTGTDSREADDTAPPIEAAIDSASDSATDSATTDAADSASDTSPTPGSVACGDDSCNADPTKGPVRACCYKPSTAPYCSNVCSGGVFRGCDDRSDCAALGRPSDVCCLLKGGASLCQSACLDGTELP